LLRHAILFARPIFNRSIHAPNVKAT
jgi:hypothetical protein